MIEKIRKIGIITKGIIYVLVGVLTFLAAINHGQDAVGKNGVISFLQNQTFGHILIWLAGIGLIGYAIWRGYSAFLDGKNEGSDKKAYVKRIGYFISGLVYASLGVSVISSAMGNQSSSSGSKESLAATILQQEWGQIVLFIVAGILVGVGVYQFIKGFQKKFLEDINSRGEIESREALEKSGRIGFIARGASFFIFAFFVFKAAQQEDADAIRGLEGMFNYLHGMQFGNVLMALMALGFIAYGLFQYFLARYSKLYS